MLRPTSLIVLTAFCVTAGAFLNSSTGPLPAPPRTEAAEPSPSKATSSPKEFEKAGVCARCHVLSVLEWSISGHLESETTCQKCHGPSRGHVKNERNQVKPDKLPRGAAIAKQLCMKCHETGCPKTLEAVNCQTCHHMHALIHPKKSAADNKGRSAQLLARWARFRGKLSAGEQLAQLKDWSGAQMVFNDALALIPGNHLATTRLEMCRRRLNPQLPGFENFGKTFDVETGLVEEVQIEKLKVSMRLVPAGSFDMGSDDLSDARPVHTVHVDAFYLGTFEVTQDEWLAVMRANPSAHKGKDFPNGEQLPVERVSWQDCQEFLKRLNARVPGSGFRLPTEAEWEYACRAAAQSVMNPKDLPQHAWYRVNSQRKGVAHGDFLEISAFSPKPVGTRKPNAWGFFDMRGNVSEWCSSLWKPYLFQSDDGRESLSQKGLRIVRGGSYADSAGLLEPRLRHADRPHRRLQWNGLRLARSVPRIEPQAAGQKK